MPYISNLFTNFNTKTTENQNKLPSVARLVQKTQTLTKNFVNLVTE